MRVCSAASCSCPSSQGWPRLVTSTEPGGASRRLPVSSHRWAAQWRGRGWQELPPVTSHHSHSDNSKQSADTRDTNTATEVSDSVILCMSSSPSKARLKISDQEEIFIVLLKTNFSSIDQIGSLVITFFRPQIPYCDISQKPGEYSQILFGGFLKSTTFFSVNFKL